MTQTFLAGLWLCILLFAVLSTPGVCLVSKGKGKHRPHMLTIPLRHKKLSGRPKLSMLALRQQSGGMSDTKSIRLEERNHVYCGPVTIGSTGQQLNVVFDTGSANLIVRSASCATPGCNGPHSGQSFNPAKSASGAFVNWSGKKTDKAHARNLAVDFASGQVAGLAFEDRVCLAGGMCANRARFLLAHYESDDFAKYEFDGILGLAPGGPLSMGMGFSVLDDLAQEGALTKRIFAFFLSGADDEDSEVTIGGFNNDRMAGDLTWLRANTLHGGWGVDMSDMLVGGKKQSLCGWSDCLAQLDSGCSGIGMPEGMTDKVAQNIGFTANVSQCMNPAASLPAIGFVLGGINFELSPREYVDVSKNDPTRCRLHFHDLPRDGFSGPSPVVLGHPFLMRYYSVYDREHLRIGLAPATGQGSDRSGGQRVMFGDMMG